MSSPAEIEVAGVAGWLVEDSTANDTVATTTPTSDNRSADIEVAGDAGWLGDNDSGAATGETGWLVDNDSPTTTTAAAAAAVAIPDAVIHAPSRAARVSVTAAAATATGDSGANTDPKKKSRFWMIPKKKSSNATNTDTTLAVNGGGDNTNNNNANNNNANGATSAAEAASQKTWGQYFRESFKRDGRLLLITLGILIVMNIPLVRRALYPFIIFSTWIHELCHGMAALLLGGTISKLEIFPDGSGLATSGIPNIERRAFVSSAGYQGTAVIGFLLLIFRRTKRGPRTGTMVLACTMILTCFLWIRNFFGFVFVLCFGLVLAVAAWLLPSFHIRNLYVVLAVTCALNAVASVQDLFGGSMYVNGEVMSTDAHTMAEIKGGSYLMWATLWFILAIVLTLMGIVFAIPGPDEVADFQCCGVCQDLGCFKLCNYPGQRWLSRFRYPNGTANETADATSSA